MYVFFRTWPSVTSCTASRTWGLRTSKSRCPRWRCSRPQPTARPRTWRPASVWPKALRATRVPPPSSRPRPLQATPTSGHVRSGPAHDQATPSLGHAHFTGIHLGIEVGEREEEAATLASPIHLFVIINCVTFHVIFMRQVTYL